MQHTVEKIILQHDICEYVFGKVENLHFSDKTWTICKEDCEYYGKSWGCPPYCGDIRNAIEECRKYHNYCIFSTVTESENAWDYQSNMEGKRRHEEITRAIRQCLEEEKVQSYVMSTRCTRCDVCACPNEPCRHPEGRFSSMESHGIMVMQTVSEAGMTFNFGMDTITYFSMILF